MMYIFVFQFLTVSLLSNYSYKCQPVDYSDSPLAVRVSLIRLAFSGKGKFNQTRI
jgi:hypothetical protein